MSTRDKLYTFDVVSARFDLNTIKCSLQKLIKYCEPESTYVYRGPHSSKTAREKSVHALEQIFASLIKLDADNKSPNIACPSDQLQIILSQNGTCDHKHYEDRLQSFESELSNVKASTNDLRNTVLAMLVSSKSHTTTAEVTTIPSSVLQSDYPPLSRPRSSSVKRKSNDSEVEASVPDNMFQFPKEHIKQNARRDKKQKVSDENNSAPMTPSNSQSSRQPPRREFKWGKSDDTSGGFTGAVPEVFISSCKPETDIDNVKSHLVTRGIKVVKVVQASHNDAYRKSFRVSVESFNDYESLVSGENVPRFVKVRRYIPPRRHIDNSSWDSRPANKHLDYISSVNELNSLSLGILTSPVIPHASAIKNLVSGITVPESHSASTSAHDGTIVSKSLSPNNVSNTNITTHTAISTNTSV